MNLAHLVRECNFKFPFLQSSFLCFSKVKLLELLILMDFALKDDKNKLHFEAFALKLL